MRHAGLCLGAIVLLHAVYAALWHVWFWNYAPDGGPGGNWMISPAIYWIPLFSLIYIWCRVDSNQRKVRLPFGRAMFVTFLFPIGVPYYFFRTHARREALVRTCRFLIFVAACLTASWLGGELTHQYYIALASKEP